MLVKLNRLLFSLAFCILVVFTASEANADLHGTGGSYQLDIATVPAEVPVSSLTINMLLRTSSGTPVSGADIKDLTQMPGMPMGEADENAAPVAAHPGVYTVPAKLVMAGTYNSTFHISGSAGVATIVIPISTGENTGTLPGSALPPAVSISPVSNHPASHKLLIIISIATVLLIVVISVTTSRKHNSSGGPKALRTIIGLLLLIGTYLGSRYVVAKYTKPGHMSVIEAQGMDMSAMRPPVGALPVAALMLEPTTLTASERVNAQAVPFTDETISARVPGTLIALPVYPGDTLVPGELLAQLDSRQYAADTAAQQAAVSTAQQVVQQDILAAKEAAQNALEVSEGINQAKSELSSAESQLLEARDAQKEAEAAFLDQQADVQAGVAEAAYAVKKVNRDTELLKGGFISQQQEDLDQTALTSKQANLTSQQAMLTQAQEAVSSAKASVAEAQSRIQTRKSAVVQAMESSKTAADAISVANSAVQTARASQLEAMQKADSSAAVQGYTRIVSQVRGVVLKRLVGPGTLVQPGEAILQVAQIDPIRIQAVVAEQDLENIHVGSSVRIWANNPSGYVTAHITSVFPYADPVAHTATVEALVPNPNHKFLPGEALEMQIDTGKARQVLQVPNHAIVSLPKATSAVLADSSTSAVWVMQVAKPQRTVWTCTMHRQIQESHPGRCPICGWKLVPEKVGGKWRAHLTPVTLGLSNPHSTVILTGLNPGEQVITHGLTGLRDGDPVMTTQWGKHGPIEMPGPHGVGHLQ